MDNPETEDSEGMVVFDLDGTLTVGKSVESAFFRYLLKYRRIRPANLFAMVLYYLKNIWRDPVKARKRNKIYLQNTAVQEVSEWIAAFIQEQGDTLFIPHMIELVRSHKNQGQKLILITGAPEILVQALPIISLFDSLHATKLEAFHDRYTGQIDGVHYYGKVKADLVKRIAAESKTDLQKSFCYADADEDREMMSLFGNPVAVSPEKQLRRVALEKNWKIIG